jgi:primosomal protein N''
MTTNSSKMDSAEVYSMFEKIIERLNKQPEKPAEKQTEPVKVDTTAFEATVERLDNAIEEVKKPSIVEYRHRHTIDFNIHSNWFFFSWVGLAIVVSVLFWALADQRETINQFKENDLKYRYIKMQGRGNEVNLYRLEQQFKYDDSIKIVRKQVERYEEMVKEQVERIERARQNSEQLENLQQNMKTLKR